MQVTYSHAMNQREDRYNDSLLLELKETDNRMKIVAEIITVGDELLIGQVIDTNSAWIGKELNKIGVSVGRIVSVSDQSKEILEAIDSALKRADIVLITGGLGPTKDDITKSTLCTYFNTELVFDQTVYDNMCSLLSERVLANKLNKTQAYVPKGCTVIQNPVGSASISWFDYQNKVLVSMPGVPDEMKTVMSQEVLPRLRSHFETDFISHKTYVVKNYPESILAVTLEDWENKLPDFIHLAYLPKPGIVRLRLSGENADRNVLDEALKREEKILYAILKKDIMLEDDGTLEEQLGYWLKRFKFTVATAESCTGGRLASKIAAIPGCSDYFNGSIVAYQNSVKMKQLGVRPETLQKHGAVSEETALEMVNGVCQALGSDCGIATTGIAGPTGAVDGKPVGTVWIAVKCGGKVKTHKLGYNSGREMNIERSCNYGLFMLMELLQTE